MKKDIKPQKKGVDWFWLTFITIVVITLWCVCEQQIRMSAMDSDMAVAQERLKLAKEENEQLKAEEARLSEEAYIEKLAREELGMTRNGEIPYIYAENNN